MTKDKLYILSVVKEIMRLYRCRDYFVTEFNSLLTYIDVLKPLNTTIVNKAKEKQVSVFDYKWSFCKELDKTIAEIKAKLERDKSNYTEEQELYYKHIEKLITDKYELTVNKQE